MQAARFLFAHGGNVKKTESAGFPYSIFEEILKKLSAIMQTFSEMDDPRIEPLLAMKFRKLDQPSIT